MDIFQIPMTMNRWLFPEIDRSLTLCPSVFYSNSTFVHLRHKTNKKSLDFALNWQFIRFHTRAGSSRSLQAVGKTAGQTKNATKWKLHEFQYHCQIRICHVRFVTLNSVIIQSAAALNLSLGWPSDGWMDWCYAVNVSFDREMLKRNSSEPAESRRR